MHSTMRMHRKAGPKKWKFLTSPQPNPVTKIMETKIIYNNYQAISGEDWARKVSMDQTQVQTIVGEDRETVRRKQARRDLCGKEQNDVY